MISIEDVPEEREASPHALPADFPKVMVGPNDAMYNFDGAMAPSSPRSPNIDPSQHAVVESNNPLDNFDGEPGPSNGEPEDLDVDAVGFPAALQSPPPIDPSLPPVYRCRIKGCKATHLSMAELASHLSVHDPGNTPKAIRPNRCQWILPDGLQCDKTWTDSVKPNDRMGHMQTMHATTTRATTDRDITTSADPETEYNCTFVTCRNREVNCDDEATHIKAHVVALWAAGPESEVQCGWQECKAKPFKSEKSLRAHALKVHKSKAHACDIILEATGLACDTAFTRRDTLRSHLLLHQPGSHRYDEGMKVASGDEIRLNQLVLHDKLQKEFWDQNNPVRRNGLTAQDGFSAEDVNYPEPHDYRKSDTVWSIYTINAAYKFHRPGGRCGTEVAGHPPNGRCNGRSGDGDTVIRLAQAVRPPGSKYFLDRFWTWKIKCITPYYLKKMPTSLENLVGWDILSEDGQKKVQEQVDHALQAAEATWRIEIFVSSTSKGRRNNIRHCGYCRQTLVDGDAIIIHQPDADPSATAWHLQSTCFKYDPPFALLRYIERSQTSIECLVGWGSIGAQSQAALVRLLPMTAILDVDIADAAHPCHRCTHDIQPSAVHLTGLPTWTPKVANQVRIHLECLTALEWEACPKKMPGSAKLSQTQKRDLDIRRKSIISGTWARPWCMNIPVAKACEEFPPKSIFTGSDEAPAEYLYDLTLRRHSEMTPDFPISKELLQKIRDHDKERPNETRFLIIVSIASNASAIDWLNATGNNSPGAGRGVGTSKQPALTYLKVAKVPLASVEELRAHVGGSTRKQKIAMLDRAIMHMVRRDVPPYIIKFLQEYCGGKRWEWEHLFEVPEFYYFTHVGQTVGILGRLNTEDHNSRRAPDPATDTPWVWALGHQEGHRASFMSVDAIIDWLEVKGPDVDLKWFINQTEAIYMLRYRNPFNTNYGYPELTPSDHSQYAHNWLRRRIEDEYGDVEEVYEDMNNELKREKEEEEEEEEEVRD